MFPADRVGVSIEGSGPLVVLLHSSMSSRSQWRKLIELLRDNHRVVAIDLHGYGDTDWPGPHDRDFGLDDEVSLVESVLAREFLHREPFHLVGHSYGGAVALHVAQRNADRVRSLTLFEPAAFQLLAGCDGARAELEALRRDVRARFAENDAYQGTARFIDYWNGPATFERISARRQEALMRLLPKAVLEFQAVERAYPNIDAYRRLRMPVCLMGGRFSPKAARAVLAVLGKLLPHAVSHDVTAGHMAPVTHPALVNPIINGFLLDSMKHTPLCAMAA
jgi:pimeloyl-ACP methyl ester carboxylesterase